jgi:molybdopterin-guanine dinucleotide biosynthesis protein A
MITEDSIKQFFIFMFYFSVTALTSTAFFQCYHLSMQRAAFVLAGGRSSRMGSDKALLPFRGRTLVEHVMAQVDSVISNVTLVGDSSRYIDFRYPVTEDRFEGCGPLAGIHAALAITNCEWNLILACDMPEITPQFLNQLMERAESGCADAVIPVPPGGVPEPLCAAYQRRCVGVIANALRNGVRKVTDGLAGLEIDYWSVPHSHFFRNLNTPQEWALYSHDAR